MRDIYIKDRDGERVTFKLYDTSDFPYAEVMSRAKIVNQRTGRKQILSDTINALDTETTTYSPELSWVYLWQWCTLVDGEYYLCHGRDLYDFCDFLDKLRAALKGDVIKVFVHNLGFEYQFLYNFIQSQIKSVFSVKSRMPIRVTLWSGIELNCSWKLTNMGLDAATKKEPGVRFVKSDELIDYRAIMFPDTPLPLEHLQYDMADVVCLCDLIQCMLRNNNDTLATMPMTSTGYVRRECRRKCRADATYRDTYLSCAIDADVYESLKSAARGGNTHANRYFVASL